MVSFEGNGYSEYNSQPMGKDFLLGFSFKTLSSTGVLVVSTSAKQVGRLASHILEETTAVNVKALHGPRCELIGCMFLLNAVKQVPGRAILCNLPGERPSASPVRYSSRANRNRKQ